MDDETFLLLRSLMRAGKVAEAQADSLLGAVDLSATRLLTLRQLEQTDAPLSLSQLASCMAFVKSNATQIVDNLEAHRLVNRASDPQDRRCTLLEMTDAGKARCAAAQHVLQPLADSLHALYTADERHQLLTLLRRLDDLAR